MLGLLTLFCLSLIVGCNDKEKVGDGEILLGQFGADWKKETFYLVVPIQWTGNSSITINSIELVKSNQNPIIFEEDGIEYEFFGADPYKRSGIYYESDVGDLKNISNFEINAEGKIVLKLPLGDVKEDNERRVKFKLNSNGEEVEKIIVWKTLEKLTTEHH